MNTAKMPTISTFHSAFLCLLVAVPTAAHGQLLSPSEFLGYELGDRFTPHHRVVAYVKHVASEATHVQLERYGMTHEGRLLFYAVISSPDNMSRLHDVRTNNLRLAGLADGPADENAPVIVWLSYNVHGNESVSTEAAMATIYDLADLGNDQVSGWLDDVVVILDPCVNPDGRDRYVHFYNRTVGRHADVSPAAREHDEPWPGGRTNHYYFDLNRDWAWGTQLETRQRLPHYNRWMPHIHVDFHEQGVDQPYYFAPAAEPYHDAITPWQRELQQLIGRNHARYFDEYGWLFFTRQIFDLFYPGYGDTWPTFNGAVGMTYEQAGSGRAGLGIITTEGDTLTLADRIAGHYTTGLSSIETAAAHKGRITREFADYHRNARTAPEGRWRTFVVKPSSNPDKLVTLARHLDMQGITYGQATQSHRSEGFSYMARTMGHVDVNPGDMIVSAFQSKGVLARVLFEPEAALSDSLSYDITAWALPYVYGLEAYALTERIDPGEPGWTATAEDAMKVDRPAAWLAEWKSFKDAQFLAALLQAGVRLRFTEEPFVIDNRTYERGTLIVTRTGNERHGNRLHDVVQSLATLHGQTVHAVSSTHVADGVDFGSSDVPYLKKPRVAVIAGSTANPYSLGEVWHYFDEQLAYPVTLVNSDAAASLYLYDFDVIILPSGSWGDVLSEKLLQSLTGWVKSGGRLIALEGAARFLAGKDGFALKKKEDDDEKKDEKNEVESYAERERRSISESVSGAIFRAHLDSTHPLAFGYDSTYFTLKRNETAFSFLDDHWNVGVLKKDARISGFAGSKTLQPLENSLVFGVEDAGRGEIVYLLDNPIFRGFWYNGHLLLANAVFLVGQRTPAAF